MVWLFDKDGNKIDSPQASIRSAEISMGFSITPIKEVDGTEEQDAAAFISSAATKGSCASQSGAADDIVEEK